MAAYIFWGKNTERILHAFTLTQYNNKKELVTKISKNHATNDITDMSGHVVDPSFCIKKQEFQEPDKKGGVQKINLDA